MTKVNIYQLFSAKTGVRSHAIVMAHDQFSALLSEKYADDLDDHYVLCLCEGFSVDADEFKFSTVPVVRASTFVKLFPVTSEVSSNV